MNKLFLPISLLISLAAMAQTPPLGSAPPAADMPRVEFAFEERVTIDPAIVLGNTPQGHRQFIPITGGTVEGPMLKGQVLAAGFDYQLTYSASGCTQFNAEYFLEADDGTVIHIFNEGLVCPNAPRTLFRPKFEAPLGKYEWMNRATFVATLELEAPTKAPSAGTPPVVEAVRIRFNLVK